MKQPSQDAVILRYFIKGKLTLQTPLAIGSGESDNTDKDIIRGWDGSLFIPGSSLAGIARHYLESVLQPIGQKPHPIVQAMFGNLIKDRGVRRLQPVQSLISFYDAYCKKNGAVQVRNGVRVDYLKKIAEDQGKFDFEVIERGAIIEFRADCVVRQGDVGNILEFETLLYTLLCGLSQGNVAIGGKTRRGFGCVLLDNITLLKLNMENRDHQNQWIDFNWESFAGNCPLESLNHNNVPLRSSPFSIHVEFAIPYSLLIRGPNPDPTGPDSCQLQSLDSAIIPGTSWTGALRSAMFNIGFALGKENRVDKMLEDLFGYVRQAGEGKPPTSHASRIIIEESLILKNTSLDYTRNRIDRFTGKVVESALFTDRPSFLGRVSLTIHVQEAKPHEKGMILLGIKELWHGIQAVGGETNVGRGILEGISFTMQDQGESLERRGEDFANEPFTQYLSPLAHYFNHLEASD